MTPPTIVFIHGGGISSWMWRPQIATTAGFEALTVDLPGHGSSTTAWVSVADAAATVARFIRERVPGGRAHLVGLSLGGVVSLEVLARYPDVVDRVLVSGTLATGLPGAGLLAGMAALMLPLGKIEPLLRYSARQLGIGAEDLPMFKADLQRLEGASLRRMVLDVANFRPPAALAERPHPVLVVAGSKEHPGIVKSLGILTAMMPNSRGVIVPGGIHTWNWQYPDRFNAMIHSWFLDGVVIDFKQKST